MEEIIIPSEEMSAQTNNGRQSNLTPVTLPMSLADFKAKFNGGKNIKLQKLPTGTRCGYVQCSLNKRPIILPVYFGEDTDLNQDVSVQISKDDAGRFVAIATNIEDAGEA